MLSLLPVLDDFDRGLVSEIKKVKDKELLKGVKLINDKFKNRGFNSKRTELQLKLKQGDAFDADIHEAITQIPCSK